jgi:hypothetical protein
MNEVKVFYASCIFLASQFALIWVFVLCFLVSALNLYTSNFLVCSIESPCPFVLLTFRSSYTRCLLSIIVTKY